MSSPHFPPPVKLFFTCLFKEKAPISKLLELLYLKYGEIDSLLGPLPFNFTSYYEKEMGSPLFKIYFSFQEKIEREKIITIKLESFLLEEIFSKNGQRIINIDPGFISLENLVLTTGKNFSHRIYLGKGVFSEITLLFKKSGAETLPWTFPDFKSDIVRNFTFSIREQLKRELKNEKN